MKKFSLRLLLRVAATVVTLAFLAACAGKHYTVCFETDESRYCRGGYSKRNAKVAAETLGSLPGVNSATVEPTKKQDKAHSAPPLQERDKPAGSLD